MLRGINKQDIFFEDKDYLEFQNIIRKTKKKFLYQLYSYVLMPNHIHLEIKDANYKLSQIIHSMATSYAMYFNKKYERKGHLFENRFQSKNVENSYYLLNLVRYIHQNPLKAGINKMEEYKWSSYSEYFINDKIQKEESFVNTEEVFEIFLPKTQKIRAKEEFMQFNHKVLKFQESTELLEYEMKTKLTDAEVIFFIKEKLEISNIQEIQKYNMEIRDKVIGEIYEIKGVSQPQIARILGVTTRIVQKAISKKRKKNSN